MAWKSKYTYIAAFSTSFAALFVVTMSMSTVIDPEVPKTKPQDHQADMLFDALYPLARAAVGWVERGNSLYEADLDRMYEQRLLSRGHLRDLRKANRTFSDLAITFVNEVDQQPPSGAERQFSIQVKIDPKYCSEMIRMNFGPKHEETALFDVHKGVVDAKPSYAPAGIQCSLTGGPAVVKYRFSTG